jgi:HAD superfamily hydrolase (TIGR01509 family)
MSTLHQFRPHAVIFDLDGTLADNMEWHTQAFDAFLRRRDMGRFTMEWRQRTDGKRNSEIFPMLFGRPLPAADLRAYADEKESLYREISTARLLPMAGATELIGLLTSAGIKVAVATSAPEANVEHTLRETGLAPLFPVIARGDQVERGKPAPDVFLYAARLLGVDPACCLAFEDAPIGVAAARAADMRCIAITSSFSADAFAAAVPPPDATCRDFEEYLATAGSWLRS